MKNTIHSNELLPDENFNEKNPSYARPKYSSNTTFLTNLFDNFIYARIQVWEWNTFDIKSEGSVVARVKNLEGTILGYKIENTKKSYAFFAGLYEELAGKYHNDCTSINFIRGSNFIVASNFGLVIRPSKYSCFIWLLVPCWKPK